MSDFSSRAGALHGSRSVSRGLVVSVVGTHLAAPSTRPGEGQPCVTTGGFVGGGRRECLGAEPRCHSRELGLEEAPAPRCPFHGDLTPPSVPIRAMPVSVIEQVQQWPWGNCQDFTQACSHSFVSVERDMVPSRDTKLGSPPPTHTSSPTLPPAGPGAWGPAVHGEGPGGHAVGTGLPSRGGPGSF